MYAKHYENPTMLSKVTAKDVGDVFETHCITHSIICVGVTVVLSSWPTITLNARRRNTLKL